MVRGKAKQATESETPKSLQKRLRGADILKDKTDWAGGRKKGNVRRRTKALGV